MLFAAGRLGLTWIGWAYFPNIISQQLLPYFHQLYQLVLKRPPPPPGSPEHHKHRRWLYTFVTFGYALYAFWSAADSIEPSYYELLGVVPTADEAELKTAFRVFAKKYHPDRAGPDSETYFMAMRDVFEALKNPTTRFAYDRYATAVPIACMHQLFITLCHVDLDHKH